MPGFLWRYKLRSSITESEVTHFYIFIATITLPSQSLASWYLVLSMSIAVIISLHFANLTSRIVNLILILICICLIPHEVGIFSYSFWIFEEEDLLNELGALQGY